MVISEKYTVEEPGYLTVIDGARESANRPRISTGHGGHGARSDLHGKFKAPTKGLVNFSA
jgi:hypothetical protein